MRQFSLQRSWRSLGFLAPVLLLLAGPADATEFGVYEGAGCTGAAQLRNFVRWADKMPERVLDFVAFSSWRDLEGAGNWGIECWASHGHPALALAIPLTVTGTDLAEVARGRGDEAFTRLARTLVKTGYGDAIIRLGHEMNGNWYPWGNLGDRDPARQRDKIATYKAAFRHVVEVLRGVNGAHFRIDWNPAAGQQAVPQAELYPGDDVVDIVGTDVYAVAWGVNHPSDKQIVAVLTQGWQLDAVAAFGRQHGKPISFPEWGIGSRPNGQADYGPGDSPEVMEYMTHWFAVHSARPGQPVRPGEIVYTGYWDYNAGDYNARVSNGERPRQGAVLKAAILSGMLSSH